MKKLLNSLKQILYNIWYFKKYFKWKAYERKIRKGILDRDTERKQLLIDASILIPKKNKKGISFYIPISVNSKAKIKAMILHEFGYKMKVLGMKITDDLKFI